MMIQVNRANYAKIGRKRGCGALQTLANVEMAA
jgi:hypothetical protein